MQDLLYLDSDGRMNVPSTCGTSNWSWLMKSEALEDENNLDRFCYYIDLYGRYDA